jgi:hypothetical protein
MEKNVSELIHELSIYCFEKQIHLEILTIFNQKGINGVELIDIKGQSTVKITLYKSDKDDDSLGEKIALFLNNLKTTP